MVVVSGGIKDVIDSVFFEILSTMEANKTGEQLEYEELSALYKLSVISNTFKYENRPNPVSNRIERTAIDYDDRLLHSMNKNEFVNEISEEQLRPVLRKNVIVMGDIVEDIDMVDPSKHDQVLKVGFLNSKKNEHLLDHYMENFDLVVTRDGPLNPANLIMSAVTTEKENRERLGRQYSDIPQLRELCKTLLA